ncbi:MULTISPECIES: hypothetical protein [unclassified Microcoleus]|uniref:hypothetical protein n=1 Tax=unclassified Microcoleus TaxID=2642155 RepID=UPI002FCECCAA
MTTSFFRYVKPWLQHQPQFDEPANLHLASLYDYWHEFWHADTADKSDLPYWENCILSDSLAYVRQGLALHLVRLKLAVGNNNWRIDFDAFCKASPIGSAAYGRSIIKAASVTIELINQGFSRLPTCIAQALPLAKFLGNSTDFGEPAGETVAQKWEEVIRTAPANRITATHVQSVADGQEYEKPTTVKIKKFKQNLADEARDRGISQQQLIEEILAERYLERSDEQVESEDCHCLEVSHDEEAKEEYTAEQQAVLDDLDVVFKGSVRSGIRSDRVSDSS